jgi:hypothetical protein
MKYLDTLMLAGCILAGCMLVGATQVQAQVPGAVQQQSQYQSADASNAINTRHSNRATVRARGTAKGDKAMTPDTDECVGPVSFCNIYFGGS